MQSQPLTYAYLINRCKIVADNSRAKKLTMQTSAKTAKALQMALMRIDGFFDQHTVDYNAWPVVVTTIYCKQNADAEQFLSIKEIMDVFLNK